MGIPQKLEEFRMFLVRRQNISILVLISVTAAAATTTAAAAAATFAVAGGAGCWFLIHPLVV